MDSDYDIDCSDEELRNLKGPWEPSAEEIAILYDTLDRGDFPELKWKCPGYRSPSPEINEKTQIDHEYQPSLDKSDFDFADEAASPKLKMRKEGEEALKGSAKKKVTSLDGVINNMRRHKLLPANGQVIQDGS